MTTYSPKNEDKHDLKPSLIFFLTCLFSPIVSNNIKHRVYIHTIHLLGDSEDGSRNMLIIVEQNDIKNILDITSLTYPQIVDLND